jgi:hypothetical protein
MRSKKMCLGLEKRLILVHHPPRPENEYCMKPCRKTFDIESSVQSCQDSSFLKINSELSSRGWKLLLLSRHYT